MAWQKRGNLRTNANGYDRPLFAMADSSRPQVFYDGVVEGNDYGWLGPLRQPIPSGGRGNCFLTMGSKRAPKSCGAHLPRRFSIL